MARQILAVEGGNIKGIANLYKMINIDINDLSPERPWTPDGVDYLIELYKLGYSAEEMAIEMNRTTGNVIGKIYDLGEEGKLSLEMWGSKKNGKKLARGPLGDVCGIFVGEGVKAVAVTKWAYLTVTKTKLIFEGPYNSAFKDALKDEIPMGCREWDGEKWIIGKDYLDDLETLIKAYYPRCCKVEGGIITNLLTGELMDDSFYE